MDSHSPDRSSSPSSDTASKSGYLYAVNGGFWPNPDGVFQLRVKLGSFRTADPVASMISSYQRGFGHPRLLWCEPSANAYADEHCDLFVALASHRVWPNREIFVFTDLEECLETLDHFSHGFRRRTATVDKPPVITDLVNPWQPQQRLEDDRARRKRAREEKHQEQRAKELEEAVDRDSAFQQFIEKYCRLGPEEKVEASFFNQAVKSVLNHGVKAALDKRGFGYKKLTVVPGGKQVWAYAGLSLSVER